MRRLTGSHLPFTGEFGFHLSMETSMVAAGFGRAASTTVSSGCVEREAFHVQAQG